MLASLRCGLFLKSEEMAQYEEKNLTTPALLFKQPDINDTLLATYHLPIYGGCEFGCPYCDSWAHSVKPIDNTIDIFVDLPERLNSELPEAAPRDVIGLTFGEPYQPIEQQHRITRKVLHLLSDKKQPCVILTKSPLVLDDIRLLQEMNKRSMAIVVMTVMTVRKDLFQLLEPKAPPVTQRIDAIAQLKEAGIPSGFALIPIIPVLTDNKNHLKQTLESMSVASPDFVVWGPLWMPNAQHRERIHGLLQNHVQEIEVKYNDIYGPNPSPNDSYQLSLNSSMLALCKQFGLQPRIPSEIYSNHLPEEITSKLIQRHREFIAGAGSYHPSFESRAS